MNTIEEKYNIIYVKAKRYYKIDLGTRHYDLDFSTPYTIKVYNHTIVSSSWKEMLIKLAWFLQNNNPKSYDELLAIRNDWGKQAVFSIEKKSNFEDFAYGLYINVNHTSTHASWTMQLLLTEWNIDLSSVELYIHRQPRSEPADAIAHYEDETIDGVRRYMALNYSFDAEKIERINKILKRINNEWCPRIFANSGYNNILIVDQYFIFDKMKKDILAYINKRLVAEQKERTYKTVSFALQYLEAYYKKVL